MANYTFLVDDISQACENDGTEFLAYVPKMVNRAEERMTRDLDDYGLVTYTSVAVSIDNNQLTLPSDLYMINTVLCGDAVVEEVDKTEFYFLNQANLSSPSETYKVYTRFGENIEVSPYDAYVDLVYYRTPLTPKWTYLSNPNGDPIYNPTASDFQDFELHPEEETQLIVKILRYAGVTIRAEDVVSVAEGQDKTEYEKENLT